MMAKALLKNNDIAFEERNIEENEKFRDFVLNEGHRTMPQIYRDEAIFVEGGYQGLQSLGSVGIKEKLEGINTDMLGDI